MVAIAGELALTYEVYGDPSATLRHAAARLLHEGVIGSAELHQQIDSTNSQAMRWFKSGVPPVSLLPRLWLTDRQTAGRGRHGRRWLSEDQAAVMSLAVDRLPELAAIAAGVATAKAIERLAPPVACQLKWPNDVWIERRKVAGILIEALPQRATAPRGVIGVGVNWNHAPSGASLARLAGGQHVAPACVAQMTGRQLDLTDFLVELTRNLLRQCHDLSAGNASAVLGAFRHRCVLTGHIVGLQQAGETLTGTCEGIDDAGCLRLRPGSDKGQHVITIRSGEIVRLKGD